MYFSDEQIGKLAREYADLNAKFLSLQEIYISHPWKNSRALEHATHGFSRRLKTMVRCVHNVYRTVPPERKDKPTRDELTDVAINIQSFVMNVFGSLDNLAWIWVSEKGQKRKDGTPIPNKQIGLGPRYESVRNTFPEEFRNYLDGLIDWFKRLGDLRDALAHRIPLYVPPYALLTKDLPAYRDLEKKMFAAGMRGDIEEYDRLSVEQLELGKFRPLIQHSFEENGDTFVFHAQMLADFNTVDEVARKILEQPKS
jgi:hypothetical protein